MRGPTPGGDDARAGEPTPEPSDADVAARWADITAQLSDLSDLEPEGIDPENPGALPDNFRRQVTPQTQAPPSGPRDYEVPEDSDDEGYTPPDLEPIEGGDPLTTMGWIGALGGPVLTLVVLVLWKDAPRAVYYGTLGACLIGAALLLWRLPKDRHDTDDDGAVI